MLRLYRQTFSTVLLSVTALLSAGVTAAETDAACQPDYTPPSGGFNFTRQRQDPPVPENAVIGRIYHRGLAVFDESDPRENNFIYRFLNRWHPMTRTSVIDAILLFDDGDAYDASLVSESARLLRQQKYLYDAAIRPVSVCEGEETPQVDLEVVTRDVWSFTPEISLDRSGGENTYRFGIRDTNIMGSGTQLSVARKKDSRRTSNEFIYKDPNVLGSRHEARLTYKDSDDGETILGFMRLPFYALDTRQAWGLYFHQFDQTDTQYFRGQDVSEVQHQRDFYQVDVGYSKGLINGVAERWTLGYTYQEDQFQPGNGLPAPMPFPQSRKLSYPFIGFERIEDNYRTSLDLDQIHRTEDLHIGSRLFLKVGYAAESLSSDTDRLVLHTQYRDTLQFDGKVFWRHGLNLTGLYNIKNSVAEDLVFRYNMDYFRKQTDKRAFFASLHAVMTENLNSNEQVLLGGLQGLRGFENEYMAGDRSLLLNLEERWYTDLHPLNLARVGYAVFLDIGKAWQPGRDNGSGNQFLMNAGFGIRLASTKAEVGRVIHIDFAFPINGRDEPGVDSFQIAINIKDTF